MDLPGVDQGLATVGLDLTNRKIDILLRGIDVAERLVAHVEHVRRTVERVQGDLLKLAVVDTNQPAPATADERLLHDPLAVWNDERGLFDDVLVSVVEAVVVT